MNPIPQQRDPNFQAGIRQRGQLCGVHVFCLRRGTVGPGVGSEMAQQGQRSRRDDRFGDRPERLRPPAGADRTAAVRCLAAARQGRAGRRLAGPSRAAGRRRRHWPTPRRRGDDRTPRWPCSPIRRPPRRRAQARWPIARLAVRSPLSWTSSVIGVNGPGSASARPVALKTGNRRIDPVVELALQAVGCRAAQPVGRRETWQGLHRQRQLARPGWSRPRRRVGGRPVRARCRRPPRSRASRTRTSNPLVPQ